MTTKLPETQLLEEALATEVLEASLVEMLKAARRRRHQRRIVGHGIGVCAAVIVGIAIVYTYLAPIQSVATLPMSGLTPPAAARPPAPASPDIAARPFQLVTTAASHASSVTVATTPMPATALLSTLDAPRPTPRATEDELFALAGNRPAALHRLPNGAARWIWLDDNPHF